MQDLKHPRTSSVYLCISSLCSLTFSILSFVDGEGLDLQRNQLDLHQRRQQKLILRLALETLSVGRLEQLVMGHQA